MAGASPAVTDTAGTSGMESAPTHVAGRWAMFHFEDPVGVQLAEDAVGNLTGPGCASGTPPFAMSAFCGDVHGRLTGNHAYFDFTFQGYTYIADTTVSADGQRMTGRFHGVADWLPYPTAWLRVPDGEPGLVPREPIHEPYGAGTYDLRLLNAASGGTEYLSDHVYSLSYEAGRLISDLGVFWYSEIALPSADGKIAVGPVPATEPALAVSMILQVKPLYWEYGQITQLSAVTGSGHRYVFAATPTK